MAGGALGGFEGVAEAGRGIEGLLKSSSGGTYEGRGAPLVFAGTNFFTALLTSGLRASSSRSSCRSYMMDDRTCSTKAAVTSSVTRRLCLSNARWRFWEIPSARLARIISYLFALNEVVNEDKE